MWLYLAIPLVVQIRCYGSITTANHSSIQIEICILISTLSVIVEAVISIVLH